ncbi:MAG: hypothetical protein AAGK32_01890, partial [Actinomycetota bacterium]
LRRDVKALIGSEGLGSVTVIPRSRALESRRRDRRGLPGRLLDAFAPLDGLVASGPTDPVPAPRERAGAPSGVPS